MGLLWLQDLSSCPRATLALLGLATAGWLIAGLGSAGPSAGATWKILLLAALLRGLLLPLPPTLSDDLLRYEWDGRVVNAGFNPYRLAPQAPQLKALRDELWERLPHREVATVYPPLALGLFSIAARLPRPQPVIKAALAAADLLACYLLLLACGRLGLPRGRAVWYAWSPLATVEIAGMGHVDALGVAAVLLTIWLLLQRPRRSRLAAAAAAAGVLAKLAPLVALPTWAARSGRPWIFWAVAALLLLGAAAPVALSTGGVPPGLVAYGVSWEFNGPLYEPLWRLLGRLRAEAALAGVVDWLKGVTGSHELWNLLYPYLYPRFLAKAALGLVLLAAVLRGPRRPGLVSATGGLFSVLILCAATVYPWYLLWVLPFAALAAQPAWLLLCAVVPLSYLPQLTGASLWPWLYLGIWGPFFVLLGWRRSWSID